MRRLLISLQPVKVILVRRKRGHFYGMTTHAKGANFLFPEARTVVDLGALYVRAIKTSMKAQE